MSCEDVLTIYTPKGGPGLDPDSVIPDGTEWCAKDDDPSIGRIDNNVVLDQTRLAGETDPIRPLLSQLASLFSTHETDLLGSIRSARPDIIVLDSDIAAFKRTLGSVHQHE